MAGRDEPLHTHVRDSLPDVGLRDAGPVRMTSLLMMCVVMTCCRPPEEAAPVAVACTLQAPATLAFSPDGAVLAVTDTDACAVLLLDADTGTLTGRAGLARSPGGLSWCENSRSLWVAEGTAGTLAELDLQGRVQRRVAAGAWPWGVAQAHFCGRVLVTDRAGACILVLDAETGEQLEVLPCRREPGAIAIDPTGQRAVVVHRRPDGAASDPLCAIGVDVIEISCHATLTPLRLPPGSTNGRGVAISPDGRWAYVAHTLGRTQLPTQMIEYGWINANAVSIIDLVSIRYYATFFLDMPGHGAADPCGVTVSPDGRSLLVSLSGVHELAQVDLAGLHAALVQHEDVLARFRKMMADPAKAADPNEPETIAPYSDDGRTSWIEVAIALRPAAYDQGLFLRDLMVRRSLAGQGPRGVAVAPDGRTCVVAMHFVGGLLAGHLEDSAELAPFGPRGRGPSSPSELGEQVFHDGTRSWQGWLSCATCHPEGREDGILWDLLNDGDDNPKNTKSLLLAHRTPPMMALGVREDLDAAVRAGFEHILFRQPGAGDVPAVLAYIKSLKPLPKPGPRDEAAIARGRRLFLDPGLGCSRCHPGPLWTDRKAYDVGTAANAADAGKRLDTPSLVECWRTAPYLAGGQAADLSACLMDCNTLGRHGKTRSLTPEQLRDLCAFLEAR